MSSKKREIYIKIEEVQAILEMTKQIREKEGRLRYLFKEYDKINNEENKRYENWANYIEEIMHRLNHISL